MSVQEHERCRGGGLVEELAEATLDTVEMLLEQPATRTGTGHTRYLQDLHRLSQTMLARMEPA